MNNNETILTNTSLRSAHTLVGIMLNSQYVKRITDFRKHTLCEL